MMALEGDIEGRLRFVVEVSPFGEVEKCEITESSGYEELDSRACSAISTRAKFHPALDADNQPVAGEYSTSVRFQIAK